MIRLNQLARLGFATVVSALVGFAQQPTEIVVAAVNNGQVIDIQRLTPHFERENPDIKVTWVTLEENTLRQRVTTDIATKGGQFDVMTIGSYEAALWSHKGWLLPIETDDSYDVDDLLPVIRDAVSHDGKLYGLPFYGETSMLYYRKDLADKVGFVMPDNPTWEQVAEFVAKVHDPEAGIYGIGLRGQPGWGANMAFITPLVNTFGGQYFDMQWKPQLTSPEWEKAVSFYVDMMKKYGPPGSTSNNFNEVLALFNEGKCAAWVDATSAALYISDPAQSKVHDKVAFATSPTGPSSKGSLWVFSWNLAIPASTKKAEAAQRFAKWATSKEYVKLVAQEKGWHLVPTGTRKSTYEYPEFQEAAPFAKTEQRVLNAITSLDNPTEKPSPYKGLQYVLIPEFQAIGTGVGQQISAALAGKTTVKKALEASQKLAEREMRKAGYYNKK